MSGDFICQWFSDSSLDLNLDLGRFIKAQTEGGNLPSGKPSGVSASVGLGWVPRFWVSNHLAGDVNAADQRPSLENP